MFLSTFKGTLLFFSANTKRFYDMVEISPQQSHVDFFKNQRYWVYFVPTEIEATSIKFAQRTINTENDIQVTLEFLKPTSLDVTFTDWEECLKKFKKASSDSSEDLVTRQIAVSNGYFLLLQHLGEIMENQEYKQIFSNLLENTISVYRGAESPFKAVDLLQAEIPGFSDRFRRKYLRLGHEGKILNIILVLSNPNANFTELKHYIDGNLSGVTRQNQKYFRELEN
jgi:hypothetical protein